MTLPGGIITFLFTSIEGSTRLWERYPDLMQSVLRRHHEILRSTIEGLGGYIFDIVGDAFYAAFTDPYAAFSAALTAQRALMAEPWGEIGELLVRMALHTDSAEPDGSGYVSLPLNRVARLLEAGYGGQILLSQTTQQMIHDRLPPDVTLRDLGVRRLRDLLHPMTIFQVIAPGLRAEFPPLKTLDTRSFNLPAYPTSFIGRHPELMSVRALLRRPEVRLVTLTGPGGTGKTRLGLRVAADLLDEFTHGACFVGLASISDPSLFNAAVAQALGLKDAGSQPVAEKLKSFLRDRNLLLVLDNFEHVISAAPAVTELLTAAPRLKVLVTSREVLRVYGEYEFPVPPLALPNPAHVQTLEALADEPAVALFLERARAVNPDLEFGDEDLRAVAKICVRLDGLPLAIELAAAWTRELHPRDILERLDSRLELLTGGARDLPARQQSLRATIDWSYHLLSNTEQHLFALLGVFAGGCTVEAVAAVAGASLENSADSEPRDLDLEEILALLVDKSLLGLEERDIGDGIIERRFVMLETIRGYARELLVARGELETLCRRHAEYYLALAEHVAGAGEEESERWTDRLEREYANIRAALEWSLTAQDGAEVGLRFGWALLNFWELRGLLSEGRTYLGRILSRSIFSGIPRTQAKARARALSVAGRLAFSQGDYLEARALLQESLTLFQTAGDASDISTTMARLGMVIFCMGDCSTARALLQQALALFHEVRNLSGTIYALNTLGEIARHEGDYEQAEQFYSQALELSRQIGSRQRTILSLHNLGHLALHCGDNTRAETLFAESLHLSRQLGYRMGIALCIFGFGRLAADRGQFERAARLLGAADAILAAIDAAFELTDRTDFEQSLSYVHAHLSETVFLSAYEEGRLMALDRAIEYALINKRS
ncbi:MAG: hypothetical protein KatS3mg057_2916 [Herpetosiphonaceae bacterium]|nr:MAG: hypothetical protein KatS3mg057_2916 [Herpetosiphonaceae bacterium]